MPDASSITLQHILPTPPPDCPHQINRSQAWLSQGRSTQYMTSLGNPQCVSLRSFKPCTCHRGKIILLPCLKDILSRSYFQSAHHPKQDRPLLAVTCDRCGGISHCFHTKHWQVEMFLQLGLILGLNQLICRTNSLPFSPARLSAAGIESKLHHHLLLISISSSSLRQKLCWGIV